MGFGALVLGPGARLYARNGRLLLEHPHGRVEVPGDVRLVVAATGRSAVSTEALRQLCRRGAVLVWLGPRASMGSTLCWSRASRAAALQLECRLNPSCRLRFARVILYEKLSRQAALLRHIGLGGHAARLLGLRGGLAAAAGVEEALGYEGQAARIYWAGLRLAAGVPARRARACDPWNRALDLGYSLAAAVAYGAASAIGLIPQLGLLHTSGWGPGLAYDLVEPLRPLVDHVALGVRGGVRVVETSSGCMLDSRSRTTLISALTTALSKPSPLYPGSRAGVLAWYIGFIAGRVLPAIAGTGR